MGTISESPGGFPRGRPASLSSRRDSAIFFSRTIGMPVRRVLIRRVLIRRAPVCRAPVVAPGCSRAGAAVAAGEVRATRPDRPAGGGATAEAARLQG
jgi:hypothetical protein